MYVYMYMARAERERICYNTELTDVRGLFDTIMGPDPCPLFF